MKSRKILFMALAICILCSLLMGCRGHGRYKEYEFKRLENNTGALLVFKDKAYMTRKSSIWWPNVIYGEKQNEVYSGIVGECSAGYIYLTTSDLCLSIASFDGSKTYMLYLKDATLPELSAENVERARLVSYGSKGFDDKDNGPQVDVTEYKEKILEIYQNEENYVIKKNFDHTDIVGDIVLQSKQDNGLFHHLQIYKEYMDYYFFVKNSGDDGAMLCVKCTEIIPEGIDEFITYRKEKFGF